MTASQIFEPLNLTHGPALPNRLAKAAMEERLGTANMAPSSRMNRLYERWSRGGVGLIITGNVMVEARAMTGAGGVVLDEHTDLAPYRQWAKAAHAGNARIWMQINHPGRQVPAALPGINIAPSAIGLDIGAQSKRFATPRAMDEADIERVITQFVTTAARAVEAGFDGVEIHAAHGYLLSQFLSPRSNVRADQWGGSLANRARLLTQIVTRTRAALPDTASLAVKLNSADFQRGGFDVDDATEVVQMLGPLGVDLVELSGGSYESPAMSGRTADAHTLAREAYFLEFAQQIGKAATMPLMLTGGITRRETAQAVRAAGVSVVGMATALALDPELPNQWSTHEQIAPALRRMDVNNKSVRAAIMNAQVRRQLRRLGNGQSPRPGEWPVKAFLADDLRDRAQQRSYRRWLAARTL